MQDESYQEDPSLLGSIGGFLWTAIKWIAVIAAIVTGAVLFSDTVSNWVDSFTGGANKDGWGTKIRDTLRGGYDGAKDLGGKAYNGVKDGVKRLFGFQSEEEKTQLAEQKTVESTNQKVTNAEVGAAAVGGLTAVHLGPAALRAGAEGAKTAASTLVPGWMAEGAGKTANGLTNAWRFVTLRPPVPYAGGSAIKATMDGAKVSAELLDEAGNAVRIGRAVKSFGTIAGEFGTAAAPVLKIAGKVLAPVGAAATGIEGFSHANELEKLGKTGSANTERAGTVLESGSMLGSLLWAPAAIVGSTTKDLFSMGNYIATGENTVNPGFISGMVKKHNFLYLDTLGGGLGNAIGDGINFVRGIPTEEGVKRQMEENRKLLNEKAQEKTKDFTDADRSRMKEIANNYRYHNGEELDLAGQYILFMQEKTAAQEAGPQNLVDGSHVTPGSTPLVAKKDGSQKGTGKDS